MAYYGSRTPEERVAEELAKLTWSEMRAVAGNLSEMMSDQAFDSSDTVQVANVLSDWAELINAGYEERMAAEASKKVMAAQN